MKKINQTINIQSVKERIPDRMKEYLIGNTVYIVNSFFSENTNTTVKDIIERLAVRDINKNIA